MERITQAERIRRHINEYGSITDTEARDMYGIRRLAARIHDLRANGFDIETEDVKGRNRYGEKTTYARYRWRNGS